MVTEAVQAYNREYQVVAADKIRARKRAWTEQMRSAVSIYKLELGCADCGYNEHPEALDFDHRVGEQKVFGIGTALSTRSIDAVLDEIEKCDVVCANCHRVRTHERRGR